MKKLVILCFVPILNYVVWFIETIKAYKAKEHIVRQFVILFTSAIFTALIFSILYPILQPLELHIRNLILGVTWGYILSFGTILIKHLKNGKQ